MEASGEGTQADHHPRDTEVLVALLPGLGQLQIEATEIAMP